MIKVILWDIDGTLLNFDKAMCSAINHVYWERLERNEITKQQVLVGRFEEFFQKQGILVDLAVPFNQEYQKQLVVMYSLTMRAESWYGVYRLR